MNQEAKAEVDTDKIDSIAVESFGSQTRLFLEFLRGESEVSEVYWPNKKESPSSYAGKRLSTYESDRVVLCDALKDENIEYRCSENTLENIDMLRDEDCVAVLTGQQAGFLTGPAYSVYKALSAVKIAAELREEGVKAVPVFWIASEDHDFTEIRKASFIGRSGSLYEAVMPDYDLGDDAHSVGDIVLDEGVESAVEKLFAEIDETAFSDQLRGAAAGSYASGNTVTKAFARLMNHILGRYGIIFTNPLNPVIRNLSVPVVKNAITEAVELRSSVFERNELLADQGFHLQVHVEEDFLPLFFVTPEGRRLSLKFVPESKTFQTRNGEYEFGFDEILKKVEDEPAAFSPSALLRPVVQDSIFPTVCYVGGAAEISYFAQNSAIYEALGIEPPPLRHRAGATLLEAKHVRTMERYQIAFEDLAEGREKVLSRLVEKAADSDSLRAFEEALKSSDEMLDQLTRIVGKTDSTLTTNAERRKAQIRWHIEALRKKYLKALRRNNKDLNRRVGDLFISTMPNDAPQERTISFLSLLNSHGPGLTQLIYDNISTDGHTHTIVRI